MANRYWVGGSGGWTSSNTANWSASSGGSGGASVPGSGDTAIFDANSGSGNVTLFSNQPLVGGFNSTGFTGDFLGTPIEASGTVILGQPAAFYFYPSATVTTNGHSISGSYLYGAVTFTDAISANNPAIYIFSDSEITLKAGTTNSMRVIDWPDAAGSAFIKSDTPGSRATITDNVGTNYVDYIEVTDIAFAGSATWYWGTGYTDGGNNTGITTAPSPPAAVFSNSLFGVVA